MWQSLVILGVGLASGVAAHVGYFTANTTDCSPLAFDCEMQWLRTELDLTEEQFDRIAQVHKQGGREIGRLAKRVRELELMLAELESERVREGYVDFLEMRSFVEARRRLNEACEKSTSELVASVGELMDIDQRQRYFSIVSRHVN